MKKFNVTGTCVPAKHYMVDIGGKLEKIMKLIDDGSYFTITRARQYGKTTTLSQIQKTLPAEYLCARISFQNTSRQSFETESAFCRMFLAKISKALEHTPAPQEYAQSWPNDGVTNFELLDSHITEMCRGQKVVLMIDEFDKVGDYHIFLQFLSTLREKFLLRSEDMDYTFHNVILAGVYDITSLKQKMIDEGLYTPSETENKIQGSPWNIAADFEVDMSFDAAEIATMLNDYETDYSTGMNINEIAEIIYSYTSGYPFMVSRICQYIDEKLGRDWTLDGVRKAVQILLAESNMLFDDLKKNIETYTGLKNFLRDLLFLGENKSFNIYSSPISLGCMFGYFKKENDQTKISNKIFEMQIYNYFISENENSGEVKIKLPQKSEIVENGHFDMELLLKKFAQHYTEIFKLKDSEFLESHGGLLFMTYLKPFINGHGFCNIESQTNDFKIDITVDYEREQFIIELKIWHGAKLHEKAYRQLANYLKIKNADSGYLLTFDFRKEQSKEHRAEWIEIDGKKIFDVIV